MAETVFLSHTSEFRKYPHHQPFIAAAEKAVSSAGMAISDMEYFAARDRAPAQVCIEAVKSADIYVGVIGMRYGSTVKDQPGVSYTELEFDTATVAGKKRFMFVLDEKAPVPRSLFRDRRFQREQDRFREKVLAADLNVKFFRSPAELENRVLHALMVHARENRPAATRYWQGRPPIDEQYFFGRDEELARLDREFSTKDCVVVSAGPGTGKSRLAAEWSARSGMRGFWTNAGSSVEQTLAALAPNLDFKTGDDADLAQHVRNWFTDNGKDLIWVVDNLADLGAVPELRAACGESKLLVTTRSADLGLLTPDVCRVQLPAIELASALHMLRSRGGDGSDGVLTELANEVGRLPLALEMLAVRLTRGRRDAAQVLRQIREARDIADFKPFTDDPAGLTVQQQASVFATIAATIESLSKEDQVRLKRLAYMADAPLPEALAMAMSQCDVDELDELVQACSRESILKWDFESKSITIHALTIAVTRSLDKGREFHGVFDRCMERIKAVGIEDTLSARSELPHYKAVLIEGEQGGQLSDEAFVAFCDHLSMVSSIAGDYQTAADVEEKTLRFREGSPEILASWSDLAVCYRALGRHEDAVELDERALAILERMYGIEHEDTLLVRHGLAISYRRLGRVPEALALDEENYRVRMSLFGKFHLDTLASLSSLASDHKELGEIKDAIVIEEVVLNAWILLLGAESRLALMTRHNLAGSYLRAGMHVQAAELYEWNLEAMERQLSKDHPLTLQGLDNLARAYRALDRSEDARRLIEEGWRPWGDEGE